MNRTKLKSYALLLIPLGLIINNIIASYKAIALRGFNNDELQHSHIAWNIFQGKLPYHDFFEHHGPLYGMLNGFILSLLDQAASFESLLTLRKISLIVSCLIGLVLFFIALEMTKSKRIASFSVAIFYMWDPVQRTVMQIRPDLLQNLFWFLGFYLFIKFYKRNNRFAMFSCGLMLGLMLCFNFKALISCFAIVIFLLIEWSRSRSKTIIQDLIFITLGASVPLLSVMAYFYSRGGLQDLIYYSIVFNFSVINNLDNAPTARGMYANIFFTLDAILTFFCLYGLQYVRYKSRSFQLMLICAFTASYIILKGLYPHNCMTFLPFYSIVAAIGLDRLVLRKFYSQHLSLIKLLVLLTTLWICLGTPMKNLLQYPQIPEERFENTRNNINWVLSHIPREQTVATLWSDCGGNVFNADPQFYWTNINQYLNGKFSSVTKEQGLIFNLEKHQTPVLAIYPLEFPKLPQATQDYIVANYRLLPINRENNCIGVRIKHPET